MLTCQVERWVDVYRDLQPVFEENYEALSQHRSRNIPLSLDHAAYACRERGGELVLVTLREDGALAGYCTSLLGKSIHYDVLQAAPDLLYIRRATRRRVFAAYRRLLRFTERELRRRGVVCWCQSVTESGVPMLESLGFAPISEKYLVKWLIS